MKGADLLADADPPSPEDLAAWRQAAHTGDGAPWLRAGSAEALARFAAARGEGVSMMEAAALTLREPPRDIGWEIIGADAPGENWEDHRDPARALSLVLRKLAQARRYGVRLQYKIWLRAAGR
ncbi:hypothetical protein [Aestuariicoccus sp. MJ-SS9]|uniref:hypothetical protein n=1 Tax=Aestuariicoccus sp. MJ-SS9 TaxID=3079855 RepID=UPI0029077248|nr:hypothetical protein [Aestuariicoccus sp. MJ-SS9]MDU8910006.1 hypothetical protein [Aestuariicoccus sp. MJ-SS9]